MRKFTNGFLWFLAWLQLQEPMQEHYDRLRARLDARGWK